MKRFLTATAALALTSGMAAADYSLTILHTNDFHARFEPISKYDGPCSAEDNTAGECFGGTARLVNAIKDAKARTNNYVLVDGGDQFQGSLFYTHYKGKMAAEMMNMLGYDGMTVGNHEFDDGPEVLAGFMEAIDFPILMSNADVSAEPLLADKLAKSAVIERGGEKIGLIGLTTEYTHELSSPGDNVVFTDSVAAVQGEVDLLTAQGINKIIVLSHSGYGVDQMVAENTTGVDVIVGGHTNTLLSNTDEKAEGAYPTMVKDTAIVQAYAYGKYLGELNVTFDDEGKIKEASGDPILIDAGVAEDETTVARIGELAQPLEELRSKVVADRGRPVGLPRAGMSDGQPRRRCDAGPCGGSRDRGRDPEQRRLALFHRRRRGDHGRSAGSAAVPEHPVDLSGHRCGIGRGAGKWREPDRRGRRSFPASGGHDLHRGHQRRAGQPHQRCHRIRHAA